MSGARFFWSALNCWKRARPLPDGDILGPAQQPGDVAGTVNLTQPGHGIPAPAVAVIIAAVFHGFSRRALYRAAHGGRQAPLVLGMDPAAVHTGGLREISAHGAQGPVAGCAAVINPGDIGVGIVVQHQSRAAIHHQIADLAAEFRFRLPDSCGR